MVTGAKFATARAFSICLPVCYFFPKISCPYVEMSQAPFLSVCTQIFSPGLSSRQSSCGKNERCVVVTQVGFPIVTATHQLCMSLYVTMQHCHRSVGLRRPMLLSSVHDATHLTVTWNRHRVFASQWRCRYKFPIRTRRKNGGWRRTSLSFSQGWVLDDLLFVASFVEFVYMDCPSNAAVCLQFAGTSFGRKRRSPSNLLHDWSEGRKPVCPTKTVDSPLYHHKENTNSGGFYSCEIRFPGTMGDDVDGFISRRFTLDSLTKALIYATCGMLSAYMVGWLGFSLVWLFVIVAFLALGIGELINAADRASEMVMAKAILDNSLNAPHRDGESTEWLVSSQNKLRPSMSALLR